ncbi:hypothetical protein DPMN_138163 [Dreissena polymorpha]|uniref:Uncharacterized protein n=1 Tax=Dreissena polymorpha TaxID=45954 RepID=A0A9D4G398_DREPO|nr:hypothetical protein DPMN_138163 [Dreissena polymorpha]
MRLQLTYMILLKNIILAKAAREPSYPTCSRYDYEERLLERVLRNELSIENMLKEIRETYVKVESALNLMHEDRHKLSAAKEEMEAEIKSRLHVGLNNMSDSLAFMKHVHEEMGTKLNDAINISMANIADAITKMTENSSKTGLQLKKDIDILKGTL